MSGDRADIANERVARLTSVMVEVTLKQHRYEDFQRFEHHVRRIDEIVECLATGGGIDYFMKVAAPSVDAYQHLIDGLLVADIGIDRYFTYVVTRAVKDVAQMPVEVAVRLAGGADPKQAE